MNKVSVLKEGYSVATESGEQKADGSITLVRGNDINKNLNILVDTGLPKDRELLVNALTAEGLTVGDINIVVGTHGHSDHIGNIGLFPNSLLIVGFDICRQDVYLVNELKAGKPYSISQDIDVIPTPGHTGNDVSVIVRNTSNGTVVIAGDAFESEDDIENETLWKEVSENPDVQSCNRQHIVRIADYIVPGHGPMFKVTDKHCNLLRTLAH